MQGWCVRHRLGRGVDKHLSLGFEILEPGHNGGAGPAIANGVNQVCDLAIQCRTFPKPASSLCLQLTCKLTVALVVGVDELSQEVWLHELPCQQVQHMGFQIGPADGAGVTARAVVGRAASQIVLARRFEESAASTAFDLAGQEVPGPAPVPECAKLINPVGLDRGRFQFEAVLHPPPKGVVNDAEVRDLVCNKGSGLRIAAQARTAHRVLDVDPATPDQTAHVKFVAQ